MLRLQSGEARRARVAAWLGVYFGWEVRSRGVFRPENQADAFSVQRDDSQAGRCARSGRELAVRQNCRLLQVRS
jgi:hypothetical protein